jgi:hypothetical protein
MAINLAIYWIFEVKKIPLQNIARKWHKNCIFFLMDLNLFKQDIKKICLLITFQQSLSSGQKTADFRRYWQILVKNCCRYIAGDLKAFYLFFALIFFTLTLAMIFVSASFFAKGLKNEGERLKVKFSSLEMVKIGRGQQNYLRCLCRHRLQSFVMMKTTV